jgi:transforming growth factor-beta-induced protein
MISTAKRFIASAILLAASTSVTLAQDIVDTAVKAGSFNTLVAAVKAAGLVDTLKSKGPFTVFAPTDDAFKKLPKGTLESLLKPENKKTLTSILTYHVVAGDYPAARILKPTASQYGIKSVEGSSIHVDKRSGVKVSGATVSKTDIKTSNGTIHVIDSVMLPPKVKAALAAPKKH